MNENKNVNRRRDLGHDALSACRGMAAGTCRLPSTAPMYLASWQLLEQKGPNWAKQAGFWGLSHHPAQAQRLPPSLEALLPCASPPSLQPPSPPPIPAIGKRARGGLCQGEKRCGIVGDWKALALFPFPRSGKPTSPEAVLVVPCEEPSGAQWFRATPLSHSSAKVTFTKYFLCIF